MTNHPPGTSQAGDTEDETLPCGRLLSSVWAAWEDQVPDDHLGQCPHCRLAVDDLERLETQVRGLDEHTAQDIQVDTGSLSARVMDLVRLELRPGRPLPLGDAGEDLRIMESVAARVLRRAAEEIPGVRAGSCRITPHPGSDDGPVSVELSVQAPLTTVDLPALAYAIRERVRVAAEVRLGLRTGDIDIFIIDLVTADERPRGGRRP